MTSYDVSSRGMCVEHPALCTKTFPRGRDSLGPVTVPQQKGPKQNVSWRLIGRGKLRQDLAGWGQGLLWVLWAMRSYTRGALAGLSVSAKLGGHGCAWALVQGDQTGQNWEIWAGGRALGGKREGLMARESLTQQGQPRGARGDQGSAGDTIDVGPGPAAGRGAAPLSQGRVRPHILRPRSALQPRGRNIEMVFPELTCGVWGRSVS